MCGQCMSLAGRTASLMPSRVMTCHTSRCRCPGPSPTHPEFPCWHGASAGLDLLGLGAVIQELFSAGLAPASQRNYQTGSRRYLTFCSLARVTPPFPVTESMLAHFVAWLYSSNLASSTVKNYLAAVHHPDISRHGGPSYGNDATVGVCTQRHEAKDPVNPADPTPHHPGHPEAAQASMAAGSGDQGSQTFLTEIP